MRRLKGFTLAEILIALGIVGVIASMTLPALNSNVQKSSTGPALAKAINTLENGNRLMLADSQARSLATFGATGEEYAAALVNYVQGSLSALPADVKYRNFKMADLTDLTAGTSMVNTTDGMSIFILSGEPSKNITGKSNKYQNRYYTVVVDTNGVNKGPNALGKDSFWLLLDLNGTVIPYGGAVYRSYSGLDFFANIPVPWVIQCNKGENKVTDGAACSGSIADNSWRVIY